MMEVTQSAAMYDASCDVVVSVDEWWVVETKGISRKKTEMKSDLVSTH